jgi:hypothetical protein
MEEQTNLKDISDQVKVEAFTEVIRDIQDVIIKINASKAEYTDYEKFEELMDVVSMGDSLRTKRNQLGFASWMDFCESKETKTIGTLHAWMKGMSLATVEHLEKMMASWQHSDNTKQ